MYDLAREVLSPHFPRRTDSDRSTNTLDLAPSHMSKPNERGLVLLQELA
jgi:hypothetical protein